jgi:hypothetical protein
MMLPVLVPLIAAALGRGGVITAVSTTEMAGGLGLIVEVGPDRLLTSGVLGGDV